MKSVFDLKMARSEKVGQMQKLVEQTMAENRGKTTIETKLWNELDTEVRNYDEQILMCERQELLNKENIGNFTKVGGNEKEDFRKWLSDTMANKVSGPFKLNLRSALVSTASPTSRPNTSEPFDTLITPSEQLLNDLGITVIPKLYGTLTLPCFDETTAGFANELDDVVDASIGIKNIVLSPRRVGITQEISKESLTSYNPTVVDDILYNLKAALWNAIANDLFDQIDTDCTGRVKNIAASTLQYTDILGMEASMGSVNLLAPSYVFRPETKKFLKSTPYLGTYGQTPIWADNKVNEYPAYTSPAVNGERIYFGDFKRAVLGIWGDQFDILVNPYTGDTKGTVRVTVDALVDVGVRNKNAFVIIGDASTY